MTEKPKLVRIPYPKTTKPYDRDEKQLIREKRKARRMVALKWFGLGRSESNSDRKES